MPDQLSNYLLSGSRHASLSPESLELMGKQAANMFLNEGLPLNEGIAKLAAAHEDINSEQIKRVAEFANTAVYLAKHDQNKTAGADSSYPQFEIADPYRIIQELSDGARPTVVTPTDIEYSKHPNKKEKVASDKVDFLLAEMFGHAESEKRASLDFSKETAVSQVMDAKNNLVAAKEHLESHGENFAMALKQAQVDYYDLVKRHILDGNSFAEVMAAAQSSGSEKRKVAEALRPVIEKLITERVISPYKLHAMNDFNSLEKVAHRVINEEHPLVTNFRSILALESEIEKVASALGQIDTELSKVKDFIKERFLVSSPR